MAINSISPTTYTTGMLICDTTKVTNGSPDSITTKITASTALDINSILGALRVPRQTTTQRLALTPANGHIVYDTTLNLLFIYQNGSWGFLQNGGGITSTASATYTLLPTDNIVMFTHTSAGTVAVTLPAVATMPIGQIFYLKDASNASTHNITITPAVGQIDNGTNVVISTKAGSVAVFTDGVVWWTVA